MLQRPIITLLTDFGAADYFVPAMKGVILSALPDAAIVDISHEVPAHDIPAAAFLLLACYRDFPRGTTHVAVVDPGVGSDRRAIAVLTEDHAFVGPDNGLFSYVLDREPSARVFHLDHPEFFRPHVSSTFHGRDVFAPIAAALGAGRRISELGREVTDPVRLDASARCDVDDYGTWDATILHIDHFGNCITSLALASIPESLRNAPFSIEVNAHLIRRQHRCYAEAAAAPEEIFAIWGSAEFLELSKFCASAAAALQVERGTRVRITATLARNA